MPYHAHIGSGGAARKGSSKRPLGPGADRAAYTRDRRWQRGELKVGERVGCCRWTTRAFLAVAFGRGWLDDAEATQRAVEGRSIVAGSEGVALDKERPASSKEVGERHGEAVAEGLDSGGGKLGANFEGHTALRPVASNRCVRVCAIKWNHKPTVVHTGQYKRVQIGCRGTSASGRATEVKEAAAAAGRLMMPDAVQERRRERGNVGHVARRHGWAVVSEIVEDGGGVVAGGASQLGTIDPSLASEVARAC
ncbi:hypothetical protein FB45DRAFT_877854 [Roridomyces roridus]|uniref:Uncharacterized protein n=1 Tax=Roridomyces roridus TaxID=1738132 RepID=A0AAD7B189_9AGAR|nr:hypothetical protein FB45DRAFT_877854 [Roridomyces roridus]